MISKKLFLLVFISFNFSFSVQAQFESNKKKIKLSIVPKKEAPQVVNDTKPKLPKTELPKKEQLIKYEPKFFTKKEDNLLKSMANTPKVGEIANKTFEVKNAGELFEERFNKKDGSIEERFKSDTFLGEFKTDSKTIRIACRDHEFPDGDRVRVWLNDQIAVNEILLDSEFKELHLELQEGFNKIEFEALNQGESGPNTAQFTIVDDKGKVVTNNKWNLTTGVKAKVIIVKEDKILKEE